ncbi:histone-lysine N-methyltransferase SETDB2 isoform X1 [Ctenopharyngodon idella]|uniref:histone-lysine N-methyltransferase SETDB2 isoform X1 n=1 Tax=Ctenopharyngodon idella TaxID=7959 RepID=UPI002230404D|nr:histone-lysine N-methyltransferase SETDB2 isoform X1 [Ctenopharyngodon idella]
MMMECEIERAKIFWEEVDVDGEFDELMEVLSRLRDAIRHNTATDREYVHAMKIILESKLVVLRNEAFEEVLIDEDILTVTVSESQCSPESLRNGVETEDVLQKDSSRLSRDVESSSDYSQMSSASRNDGVSGQDPTLLLSPLSFCSEEPRSPVPLVYQPHDCSPACVPQLPAHADRFLGHNPLRVPMLCQFQRHCVRVRAASGEQEDECDAQDVIYKAPCGRGLRSMEEVLQFLLQSDTLGVLQPNNFSFNSQVFPEHPARAPASSALLFERDLSHGIEPVPVPLFNEVDGTRLKEFRYRKERWPHGCFLSAAPFFTACCDCEDGCADDQSCACVQLTVRAGGHGHAYRHQRLSEPLSAGLFECGPWCSCKKSLCQNRVVQKGLRVRLQVFRTLDRGWAVRCSDDLDKGTFICIYAGVVLRLEQSAEEPPDLRSREAPVSDDEVEVVEEWTLPTGPKETVPEMLDCSPPLYVPVIQRPADQSPGAPLTDQQQSQDCSETEREKCEEVLSKKPRLAHTGSNGHNDRADITSHTHQRLKQDKMYYLDASKEGNVARFINHSCEPNLFIQNVFVDTHDPQFPLIAFFTNRSVKAGTELTWNYSYTPGSDPDHEVSCRCASTTCQSLVI